MSQIAVGELKITADERMNVPQKCTIGVRWLATAHTYPFLLIYLTILSMPMFWSSIPVPQKCTIGVRLYKRSAACEGAHKHK